MLLLCVYATALASSVIKHDSKSDMTPNIFKVISMQDAQDHMRITHQTASTVAHTCSSRHTVLSCLPTSLPLVLSQATALPHSLLIL